jgi:hypothetical protein
MGGQPSATPGTPIDRAKLLSVGYLGRRTRDTVTDGVRPTTDPGVDAGKRCKATTDELGNTITVSDNRQDVTIRAPHVQVSLNQQEVRQ